MKRPYVVINCAISSDGKIADASGKQIRISCEEDIKRMYELRNQSDAVLVGINTVLSDNPRLTVKEKYVKNPRQPIRIVLDTYCKTPIDSLVVNTDAKTFIITGEKFDKNFGNNVEKIVCSTKNGLIDLEKFLDIIYKKGIKKLMVEGGGTVIYNFLKFGFFDDFFVYVGSIKIDGGKTPPFIVDNKIDVKSFNLKLVETKDFGLGKLSHYRLIK
ncbi:MAG: dihydrofolate reductase family protein [Candidatus Thermoplasmatota archaeon]|jgi:2,5-diamino-6-(ribosylamino)-4(3H)-pyrimidinone 5'-phosphate reductase|nr:dihydrofolate reductase family protein [Candidatus Thermoplasmatota archaeon]